MRKKIDNKISDEFYLKMVKHYLKRNGFPTIKVKLKTHYLERYHHLPFCSPIVFTDDLPQENVLIQKMKIFSEIVCMLNVNDRYNKYYFIFFLS